MEVKIHCKGSLQYKITLNRKNFSFDCQNFQLFPLSWNFLSILTFNTVFLILDARETVHFTMKKVTFLKIFNYCAHYFLKLGKWLAVVHILWNTLIPNEARLAKVLPLKLFQTIFCKTELTLTHVNKLCLEHVSEWRPASLGMEEMLFGFSSLVE